ncbi:hypothetical protein OAO18_08295, partial [Francisellaceae bacterium]|nr:hypothetical protein [Francisellaceae bacterium]
DPTEIPSADKIKQLLVNKFKYFQNQNKITITWFGMGDNPYFSIGIDDLVGFQSILAPFLSSPHQVDIHILTNERSLTDFNLSKISKLPFSYTIDIWTLEKEENLLKKSLICFIPVNRQPFSQVKSLNRALSALKYGNQILSTGYNLYDNLSEFIYNDAYQIINDLNNQKLLVCPETLNLLLAKFDEFSSPKAEAKKMLSFIQDLKSMHSIKQKQERVIAVLHGVESSGFIHKFAQKSRCLSVGTPFSSHINLNFDLRFQFCENFEELLCLISDKALPLLNIKEFQSTYYKKIIERKYYRVHPKLSSLKTFPGFYVNMQGNRDSIAIKSQIALYYANIMSHISTTIKSIINGTDVIISEQSRDAWWLSNDNFLLGGEEC